MTRGHLLLSGAKVEPNSAEEGLAQLALTRQSTIHYLTTVSIINAIIQVGNTVASAVSGSPSSGSGDAIKKALDELRNTLFPEEVHRVEEKAKKVKKMMEEELAKGPFKVQSVGNSRSSVMAKGSSPRFRRQ